MRTGTPGAYSVSGHVLMHTEIYRQIFWLWMGVFAIWAIGAILSRQTIGSHSTVQSRIAVLIVGVSWWLLFGDRFTGALAWRFMPVMDAAIYTGVAFTVAGLGLAVWARFTLGANWGSMIELKQDHQLIRKGPYSIVRHPIYSGFMLASFGTALVEGEWHGLIAFTLIFIAWAYKSRLEDAFLLQQFGSGYADYRKHVKGLIPFVW
jgi:protein-S-isoprenylcysteine O-methyltransferase Ste14